MKKTLVVLAAGIGSRFGGLKQLEPVGPNGEFIIDYSIYSAIRHGFDKVVFVIKEENYELFKETIGSRIRRDIPVEYAFQKIDDIPAGFEVPEGRVKPWGTAHALYSARNLIEGSFSAINADDYYGDDAFRVLSEYLDTHDNTVLVGYHIGDTLSENGAVKRGIIMNDGCNVTDVIESSCILDESGKVKCVPLDSSKDTFYVEKDQYASMMMNGFTYRFLKRIGDDMEENFNNNKEKLSTFEFLIPDEIASDIKHGGKTEVIGTTSKWMGITYKEDLEDLKAFITREIESGVYPNNLWK